MTVFMLANDCSCLETGAQRSNVGELPPSDSDDPEEEEAVKKKDAPKPRPAGQSASELLWPASTMGMLPPSDSEEEDDDDESSDDEPEYFKEAPKKK